MTPSSCGRRNWLLLHSSQSQTWWRPSSPSKSPSLMMSYDSLPTSKTSGKPVGRRRRPPLFLYDNGSSRTTNALESFHHTLNSLLTYQHPIIWKLLESLESQQNLLRSTIFKIGRGDSFRPTVQERISNERIQNLVSSYTQATADDLRRGIAYNYMI